MEKYMTKRGSCSFGSSKIIMEGSLLGHFSNLLEGYWGNGETKDKFVLMALTGLVSYTITFAVYLILYAGWQLQRFVIASLSILAVTVFIYHRMKGVSKQKTINYDSIESVKFVNGVKWISNPRFLIRFRQDDEKRLRYLIMPNEIMPGIEEEIEQVKKEFDERDIEIK